MKRTFSICISVIVALVALSLGVDQVWAQPGKSNGNSQGNSQVQQGPGQHSALKDAEKAAAAFRKSQGLPGYTTNDDRWVAAQTNADARAEALRKAKGGAQ